MGRQANISFNIRQLVIFHRDKGKSYNEIGKILSLSKSTVADIVKSFNNDKGRIESISQSDRPKVIDNRERRRIIGKVEANFLSAPKLVAEVSQEMQKNVHPQAIRRLLKENGCNRRVSRMGNIIGKKPFINEIGRNEFDPLKNLSARNKNDVIFADESKFNVSHSDGNESNGLEKNEY